MSVVDLLLIGAVAVFAFAGWRQGFVASVLSFTGFLAGGIAAALVLPDFIEQHTDPGPMRAGIVAFAVLACAFIAQLSWPASVTACATPSPGARSSSSIGSSVRR